MELNGRMKRWGEETKYVNVHDMQDCAVHLSPLSPHVMTHDIQSIDDWWKVLVGTMKAWAEDTLPCQEPGNDYTEHKSNRRRNHREISRPSCEAQSVASHGVAVQQ